MTTVAWTPGLAIQQDPDATLDYNLDLTDWLGVETIASHVVVASNCTAASVSSTATSVKVRVSAVTSRSAVTVRVTTSSGQVDDFTISFIPVQR